MDIRTSKDGRYSGLRHQFSSYVANTSFVLFLRLSFLTYDVTITFLYHTIMTVHPVSRKKS